MYGCFYRNLFFKYKKKWKDAKNMQKFESDNFRRPFFGDDINITFIS